MNKLYSKYNNILLTFDTSLFVMLFIPNGTSAFLIIVAVSINENLAIVVVIAIVTQLFCVYE